MIDEHVCCCFMGQFPEHVITEERALREAAGKAVVDQVPQCQTGKQRRKKESP